VQHALVHALRFYEASERVYERVLHWYEGSLEWVMARRPAALVFSVAILVSTGVLFWAIPKGFLPSEDNSQIFGTTETVEGTSFDDLVRHQQQVMAVLQADPNVDATMSFLGGGQINQGRVFMQLKPRSQRDMSVDELIRYFNRDRAAALGVTARQVEQALYDAYGSAQVSTIYTATNQYWVVMELLPQYQQDLSALSLLYVRSNTGTLVPLASLATLTSTVGPL